MYISVKLLNGYQESLLYTVPQQYIPAVRIGSIIRVPLRNRHEAGIIDKILPQKPQTSFAIKDIAGFEAVPDDAKYHTFIQHLAEYYQTYAVHFYKRIRQFLKQKEERAAQEGVVPSQSKINDIILTAEQQKVCDFLKPSITTQAYTPTVLHGVTGAGKTEVYKELITHAVLQQKTAVLLLPEVTLAVRFLHLLKTQLPTVAIFGFHSATSVKEKRALWKALVEKKPVLIIGCHLPVLLPISNLGIIIIDEEHEVGYQEKKHPKINSKEAALLRAQQYNVPILLGSATPSVSSLYNVKQRGWHFFQIKKRFAGEFPTINVVHLPEDEYRKNFWISRSLEKALKDRLAKREQAIIFLNRRGFSFFVQCKKCSYLFSCSNCSVTLTLHQNDRLVCHYCAFAQQLPACCPGCKKGADQFLKKGVGTQQIVQILQKLLPDAEIERADLDATINKKQWEHTLEQFAKGNIDILVGTQTITKGYHFPNVTLVGVLWADLNLNFPIFNAAETTLQQLIQVAGRAGRGAKKSSVVIQTMINHPIFNFLNEIDYVQFYNYELEHRQLLNYPPVARFVEIELKSTNETIIEQEAYQIARFLEQLINQKKYKISLLGPAQPPVAKVKNVFSRRLYLKGGTIAQLIELYKILQPNQFQSSVFFTPNPLS